LVDALDSGSSGGNPVKVRVLSRAPSLFSMGYEDLGNQIFPFDFSGCAQCVPNPAESQVTRGSQSYLANIDS
jgi:hypothetical protein